MITEALYQLEMESDSVLRAIVQVWTCVQHTERVCVVLLWTVAYFLARQAGHFLSRGREREGERDRERQRERERERVPFIQINFLE